MAMILNDAYGGHRKWWDPEWVEDPALASVYTEWDYILLRVYQYVQDYTSEGYPIWVTEDPDVEWEVEKRASYIQREISKYKESHELKDWEYPVAQPHTENMQEPPSMEKWLKRLDEEAAGRVDNRPAIQGRPPTPEELAAMQADSENR